MGQNIVSSTKSLLNPINLDHLSLHNNASRLGSVEVAVALELLHPVAPVGHLGLLEVVVGLDLVALA